RGAEGSEAARHCCARMTRWQRAQNDIFVAGISSDLLRPAPRSVAVPAARDTPGPVEAVTTIVAAALAAGGRPGSRRNLARLGHVRLDCSSSFLTEGRRHACDRFREGGGPEVLRLEEVPDPLAANGQLLVHVEAAAVN